MVAPRSGAWIETKIEAEIILWQSEDGKTKIEVRLQEKTVWLYLNQISGLFQRDKSVIFRPIRIEDCWGSMEERG